MSSIPDPALPDNAAQPGANNAQDTPTLSPADTAKKLVDQAIDIVQDVGTLAKDIPVDTAKTLAAELRKLLGKIEGK